MIIIKKKLFYLILSIVFSFFISNFLTKEFFIADTPYFKNYSIAQYVNLKINNLYNLLSKIGLNYFSFLKKNTNQDQDYYRNINKYNFSDTTLKNIQEVAYQPLNKLSKGIYAQSKENVVNIIIKKEEIEWITYELNINGKKVKLTAPKNNKKITEEELRKIIFND